MTNILRAIVFCIWVVAVCATSMLPDARAVSGTPSDEAYANEALDRAFEQATHTMDTGTWIAQQGMVWRSAGGVSLTDVIVTYRDAAARDQRMGVMEQRMHLIAAARQTVTPEQLAAMHRDSAIVSIQPEHTVTIDPFGAPPTLASTGQKIDYGMERTNARAAHQSGYTGSGVRVCVLDTGIEATHEDLTIAHKISTVSGGTAPQQTTDINGHGTHVAGIIGARDNDKGYIGAAPDASLYIAKVFRDDGTASSYDILLGMEWCIMNNVHIMNMSFGGSSYSLAQNMLLDIAEGKNIVSVVSSGNDGCRQCVLYPAAVRNAVAVSATDEEDRIVPFSSTGDHVVIAAPGMRIKSTYLNNTYTMLSGTSMAAPYVSGVMALYKQQCMSCSAEQLRRRMFSQAVDKGAPGWDTQYGYGIVKAPSDTTPSETIPTRLSPHDLLAPPALVVSQGTHASHISVRWTPYPRAEAYQIGYGRIGDTQPHQATVQTTTTTAFDVQSVSDVPLLAGVRYKVFVRPKLIGKSTNNGWVDTWTYGIGFVQEHTDRTNGIIARFNEYVLRDPTQEELNAWSTGVYKDAPLTDIFTVLSGTVEYRRVSDVVFVLRLLGGQLSLSLWDVAPYVDAIRYFVQTTDPALIESDASLSISAVLDRYRDMLNAKVQRFVSEVESVTGGALRTQAMREAQSWIGTNQYTTDFAGDFSAVVQYVHAIAAARTVQVVTDGALDIVHPMVGKKPSDYAAIVWANDECSVQYRWYKPQVTNNETTYVQMGSSELFVHGVQYEAELTIRTAQWKKFADDININTFFSAHPMYTVHSAVKENATTARLRIVFPSLTEPTLDFGGISFAYQSSTKKYVSTTVLSVLHTENTSTRTVTINRPQWAVHSYTVDWIGVHVLRGASGQSLDVRVPNNPLTTTRTGSVIVRLADTFFELRVAQEPPPPPPQPAPPPPQPAPPPPQPALPPPQPAPPQPAPPQPAPPQPAPQPAPPPPQPAPPPPQPAPEQAPPPQPTERLAPPSALPDPDAAIQSVSKEGSKSAPTSARAIEAMNNPQALDEVRQALLALRSEGERLSRADGIAVGDALAQLLVRSSTTSTSDLPSVRTMIACATALFSVAQPDSVGVIAARVIEAIKTNASQQRSPRDRTVVSRFVQHVAEQAATAASTVPVQPLVERDRAIVQWDETMTKLVRLHAQLAQKTAQSLSVPDMATTVRVDVAQMQKTVHGTIDGVAVQQLAALGVQRLEIATPEVRWSAPVAAFAQSTSFVAGPSVPESRGSAVHGRVHASVQLRVQRMATDQLMVYIPSTVDRARVLRIDDDGAIEAVVATYDEGLGTFVVRTDRGGAFVVVDADAAYDDVPSTHWAKEAIDALTIGGVVLGQSERAFAPDARVRRAEFAKMIVRARGVPLIGNETAFSDVPVSEWYAPYVAAAVKAGMIKGFPDGTFGPDKPITREQLAVMIASAVNTHNDSIALTFRDAASIAPYARDAIARIVALDVLRGREDGTFDPKATPTRAETAMAVHRLRPLLFGW